MDAPGSLHKQAQLELRVRGRVGKEDEVVPTLSFPPLPLGLSSDLVVDQKDLLRLLPDRPGSSRSFPSSSSSS